MYDLKDERWIKNLKQVKEANKKVVLTFDDGPSRHLNTILNILKEKNVQAIFFWQSKLLYQERPWQRVIDEGHMIASHAHNHKNLVKLTRGEQFRQINNSIRIIENVTGSKVGYFRPPFGQYNEDTMEILKEFELTPIMWEITSYDWENKHTPHKIVCNVVDHIIDGSIILLHELEQTVSILPELIDNIRDKGFEFTLL
ncbi:polysaccharide deacetylase [Anaerobacillus alkalilacustris]|uniref:Polysaccharide deacetylase n=1 Tax=Anaerobacillus alkalilacustris TaxID=393763 RepID=A0A1S2LPF0_9BACI|nr:polysaccharide deacetylase family protein [Anaerobacillus alkalilacustris]OIJ14399.1 polysaccharide deacetylase [Anaerobacillus alkalilacustris]